MSLDEFAKHLEELLNMVAGCYGADAERFVIKLRYDEGDSDPLRDRLAPRVPGESCCWAIVTVEGEMRQAGPYATTSEDAFRAFLPDYRDFFHHRLPRRLG